jgi:endonuclease/exonuclease/phosphatase family metal-dependent hydrolase
MEAMATDITGFQFYGSFCRSPAMGGVMIIVRNTIIGSSASDKPIVLDRGRCIAVKFGAPMLTTIICIHITPSNTIPEKKALLDKVKGLANIAMHCTFLAGDFNFIGTNDMRFTAALTHEASDDDPVALHFEHTFNTFTEIHQGQCTRKQIRNQRIDGMARLDRIYTDIRPGDLQDLRPIAAITHILTDPTFPSDHVPVRGVLAPPHVRPPTSPRVPAWVTDHPNYEEYTHLAFIDANFRDNDTVAIHDLVDILHFAARNIMREKAVQDPQSAHIKLHWATVLLRGHRAGDRSACQRAIDAYPSLIDCISTDFHTLHDNFHQLLTDLTNQDTQAMIDSMNADTERAAWKKLGVREALRRRAAAWAPQKRTTSAFAVLDAQGRAAADHEQAARLLRDHWQPAFKPPNTFRQAQLELLQYSAEAPVDFDWDISDEDIDNAIFHYHDSAPGPDGLPYSAWARAHPAIIAALRQAFRDFLNGGVLPMDFNKGNMVFIPKGELEDDYIQVQRTPDATRPITLSNTVAKLFAKIINGKLADLACCTVHGNQRGFVRGRRMQDNIIETESLAIHLCKYFAAQSGTILFDFASAFPSIGHSFIFAALQRLGVPNQILTAIRKLYSQCAANILIGGCNNIEIQVLAGIKQGCPASGSIFALALDPFVRLLCLRLPRPLSAIGAFADDIVITVMHLMKALRDLFPLFDLLAQAAGLQLNTKKTVIIPLSATTEFEIRRFLVDTLPGWGGMHINSAGKLLGIMIGPEAANERWTAAASKFWTRSRDAKATTGGFTQGLLHYRVFAVPVLQHLMSYSAVPKAMRHMENLAIQGLTHSPFNTFPCGAVSSLTDIGYPREAPSLVTLNTAALARTALTSAAFAAARARYYSDDLPDDALLHPREVPWLADSSFNALLTAYEHIHKLPINISDLPIQHLQGHLAAAIRRSIRPGPWPSLLHRRAYRWLPDTTSTEIGFTMQHIHSMSRLRPHPMVLNYLRVILNGLPTASRMQGSDSPCILCRWPGGDRVEHLVQCEALMAFTARHCPDLHRFQGPVIRHRVICLVMPAMPDKLLFDVCLFCNIIYSVHTAIRHGASSAPAELAEARLRQLRVRHASLR